MFRPILQCLMTSIAESQSSITDWIQTIVVLIGIPGTLIGLYKLIKKDKDRERKISALENLATSQNKSIVIQQEQINQLTLQTGEFKYHSELMLDANKLFEKQLDLQTKKFNHEINTIKEQKVINDHIRKSEIKPYFTIKNEIPDFGSFGLILKNNGGTAKKVNIKLRDDEFYSIQTIPADAEKGKDEELTIRGNVRIDKTTFNNNTLKFTNEITFVDIDGNWYSQKIIKYGPNKFTIEPPILIEI